MAIKYHPEPGTILICDYHGFISPEMIKRRPVIVISPRLRERPTLCTVVPLSTTEPDRVMNYHHRLCVAPPLPEPYDADFHWVKGDMFSTVSFDRLFMPKGDKDADGKRIYDQRIIDRADLIRVQQCILHGLGLGVLTDYL